MVWTFVSTDVVAGLIVESTFESGDFFSTTGAKIPYYRTTDGNPGGFIRAYDDFNWNGFHAPAAFLGDKSAAYGGILNVDQRLLSSDNQAYSMVVISNGTTSLQFRTPPPGTAWTSYDIGLTAAAGWEIMNTSGGIDAAATEAQLQAVLSNLVFMNF